MIYILEFGVSFDFPTPSFIYCDELLLYKMYSCVFSNTFLTIEVLFNDACTVYISVTTKSN